ncbi:hypothetical protein RD792_002863 [Penstemon davidsonii]|uniref:protein-serine/threonine phosphatase n=1 Tax=Penstemon davidsonii TaxID=160366 RepID=A0ABR0DS55_9LAMI|nr:hypothetical protein RD792_002863 [Penstemon davidsonii]
MAEICRGVVSESEGSCESSSRAARRNRIELRQVRIVPVAEDVAKRRRLEICDNAVENCGTDTEALVVNSILSPVMSISDTLPKFGMSSVCGRRRDMEDAVAIHPSFRRREHEKIASNDMHYFGVYDGHGCSHVATKCRERLHDVVKEELMLEEKPLEAEISNHDDTDLWKCVMERSFVRMDKEVTWNESLSANCRCELQTPECDAVGSTAVVAVVTPRKIVIANCGDSRAVLCRNGQAFPLSIDHKPDRPDELSRIQAAGGRVIYWEGARVLGVLAMSRAIGDNYLKPYVSCEPEVTITERTEGDECLILASDGLWDVVSNETACSVARMCLRGKTAALPTSTSGNESSDDRACSDASLLLTKLALARRSADNVSVVVIDLRKPM